MILPWHQSALTPSPENSIVAYPLTNKDGNIFYLVPGSILFWDHVADEEDDLAHSFHSLCATL